MIDIEEYKKEERRRYQRGLIKGDMETYSDKPHNIIQNIKQGFQKQKENIMFKKEETQSRRYEQAKRTKQITEKKAFIRGVNQKAREQRFAPFKAFANKVSQRTKSRSRSPVNNLGRSPGDNTGSIFTASSNSPNNIYFRGSSGNNPFTFTRSAPAKAKRKGKRIIINL